jgi:hypothetical protein
MSRPKAAGAAQKRREAAAASPRVQAMQSRHERLRRNCERLWDAEMRPRYFVPSQRLRALRQRALDLAEGGTEDDIIDAIEAADDQATIECEAAEGRYRKDRENALAKLARKQNTELQALVKGRQSEMKRMRREKATRPLTPRQ